MSNEATVEAATEVQATKQVSPDGRLTIRLTDRQPIRIKDTDWPLLAEVIMPLYFSSIHEFIMSEVTGNSQDHDIISMLHVLIRRHADGRSLIYGIRNKSADGQKTLADELGGELVANENEFVKAINRCAKQFIDSCGGCSSGSKACQCLVFECLSKLPPLCIDEETPQKSDTGVVVLNGGQPVKISPSIWPLISEAKESLDCLAYFYYERLAVRQHVSGKTLVYGHSWYNADCAAQFNIFNPRGGELLPAGEDLVTAVKRVGAALGMKAATIRACINGLPSQDLD
ncbi:MAG: hypothetical protein WCJ02_16890 [bacterium]